LYAAPAVPYLGGMKHTPMPTTGQIVCPRCRSTQVHAEKRGWNLATGFLGSSKIMLKCLSCGWEFAPPEDPRTKWTRWIVAALILGFLVYTFGGH
jgi:DNA-directed RNA polymerase subunit RPC12/RpoP